MIPHRIMEHVYSSGRCECKKYVRDGVVDQVVRRSFFPRLQDMSVQGFKELAQGWHELASSLEALWRMTVQGVESSPNAFNRQPSKTLPICVPTSFTTNHDVRNIFSKHELCRRKQASAFPFLASRNTIRCHGFEDGSEKCRSLESSTAAN